jgi:hypothetical protein
MLGLSMALILSVVPLVIFVIRGSAPFDRLGTTIGSTIALYLAAGLVGGLIFGLLLPLTVFRAGASFVGMLAAVPIYIGAAILTESSISSGLIAAAFVGAIVGYRLWSPLGGASETSDSTKP